MRRRVIVVLAGLLLAQLSAAQTVQPMRSGVVPVVAHLPGAEGSLWRTNLYVAQTAGSAPAVVGLTLRNPSGPDWYTEVTVPAAGGALEVEDVVRAVAPVAPDGKYVLVWDATQPVVVTSRTFTVEASGTYGQGIGSVAPGSGFGPDGEVRFPAPVDSGTHRVNVGVANAGAGSQTFRITVRDAAGHETASWERTVAAGAIVQLRANETGSGAGSVTVRCLEGCDGTAFAYLSVVVNDSNDAYFQYVAAAGGESSVAPVSVQRDERGVWYVTGGTLGDAFEQMGYLVASDRLWQLELFRRTARGTMAEVFGPAYLADDVLVRTIAYTDDELMEQFGALSEDARTAVRAYVQGLNRRIAEVEADPAQLPFEFKVLGSRLGETFVPARWTVADVLAWLTLLQRNFDPEALHTGQLDNARLLAAFQAAFGAEQGAAMFADLRWINDPAAQTMIPPEGETAAIRPSPLPRWDAGRFPGIGEAARALRSRLEGRAARLQRLGARVPMGSYAWVVSSDRTASGRPVLYSGPQMGFAVPSVILEGSIRTIGYEVSGMTVAGIPGMIIGRTPHHAWSMQVGHAHTTDLYLESPDALTLHRVETIRVAGGPDVQLPVFRTVHGPVVYPAPYDPDDPGTTIVAWRYAHWGYEVGAVEAFLEFARATSVDQFAAAIEKVAVSQHFCYADRDGNIAYWMSGRDPVRPDGVDPRFPLLGDGTQEWPEPVRLKPRAHAVNPAQGFFGGWNNKAATWYDNSPQNAWYTLGPAHRAHVITGWLAAHDGITFEQARDLAIDIAATDSFGGGGTTWSFVADRFRAAVQANQTPERKAAIDLLDGWDGHFVDGGPSNWVDGLFRADAWVLQDRWIREVLRLVFEDEFEAAGLEWDGQPLGLLFNVLLHALSGESASVPTRYDWFQDASGSGLPTDPDALIVTALDTVLAELGPRPWNQARGKIRYVHPMLGEIGTTPFGSRSTYAQVVEFGPDGPVRIESMFPLGESGTILMDEFGSPVYDPHFFSMKEIFDSFQPRPFPLFH